MQDSSSLRRTLEPGDVVVAPDGREALVTARVEAEPGPLAALREVAITPTPFAIDESIISAAAAGYPRIRTANERAGESLAISWSRRGASTTAAAR